MSKAAVEHQSQQATTGIIAEMETYTKAIMQAALRQASATAAAKAAKTDAHDGDNFEEILEDKGQQKLVQD